MIVGFGLPPLGHSNDPIRAVETSLEIQTLLQEMRIPFSIGITTGLVNAENLQILQERLFAEMWVDHSAVNTQWWETQSIYQHA